MRITRESIPHTEESLRCLHLALPAFDGGLHRHAHLELTWIERGHGLRWVGDSVEPYFDGDLVLVGSETPHLWASPGAFQADPSGRGFGRIRPHPSPARGQADGKTAAAAAGVPPAIAREQAPEHCTATVVQFPPDWLERSGLPELKAMVPLLSQTAAGVAVQGTTRTEVQALLSRLPGLSAPRRVAVFIEALDCLLAGRDDLRTLSAPQRTPLTAARGAGTGPPRIDRVLNWIESHLAERLSVEAAAAVAHISPAAFGRYFQREVGKSFTTYVNDARCGWAALRLIQGGEAVAQVAHSCGFPTLSNFGEQFQRRYGLAPREFRASHGSNPLRKPPAKQKKS